MAETAAELDSARAALAEKERELGGMQEALADRDRRIKEVELKLLTTTQEMEANDVDFAQCMRNKENELKECKVLTDITSTSYYNQAYKPVQTSVSTCPLPKVS